MNTARATESQRRRYKLALRVLIPLAGVEVLVMALAASHVIPAFWLFVALAAYLAALAGMGIWLWVMIRRAKRQPSN